jgi:hypothetical protein
MPIGVMGIIINCSRFLREYRKAAILFELLLPYSPSYSFGASSAPLPAAAAACSCFPAPVPQPAAHLHTSRNSRTLLSTRKAAFARQTALANHASRPFTFVSTSHFRACRCARIRLQLLRSVSIRRRAARWSRQG